MRGDSHLTWMTFSCSLERTQKHQHSAWVRTLGCCSPTAEVALQWLPGHMGTTRISIGPSSLFPSLVSLPSAHHTAIEWPPLLTAYDSEGLISTKAPSVSCCRRQRREFGASGLSSPLLEICWWPVSPEVPWFCLFCLVELLSSGDFEGHTVQQIVGPWALWLKDRLHSTDHICITKPQSLHSRGPLHTAPSKVLGSSVMPRIALRLYCLAQTKIMPATTVKFSSVWVNSLSYKISNNKINSPKRVYSLFLWSWISIRTLFQMDTTDSQVQ